MVLCLIANDALTQVYVRLYIVLYYYILYIILAHRQNILTLYSHRFV